MKRVLSILLAGSALVAAAAAPAGAAALSGFTSLTLEGSAASALKKQKVTSSTIKPAALAAGPRVLLPVTSGTVARTTSVKHGGTWVLTRKVAGKKRTAKIGGLRFKLAKRSVVTANVNGGKRITLLTLDLRRSEYRAKASDQSVLIETTRASLTKTGAAAIAKRLRLKRVRTGLVGIVSSKIGKPGSGVPVITTTGGGGGTSGPAPTNPDGTPKAPADPAKPGATTQPPPPVPVRPASAVDVTPAPLLWHVRESWIQYLAGGLGGGTPSGGATAGSPTSIGGQPPLIYDFTLPALAGSWYDAPSHTARLLYSGTVRFKHPDHGIDFTATNLEVEISATGSRVIVTYGGGGATGYQGRGLVANLPSAGQATGPGQLFDKTPGAVPAEASSSIFAGFYSPGEEFGWFSTSYAAAG